MSRTVRRSPALHTAVCAALHTTQRAVHHPIDAEGSAYPSRPLPDTLRRRVEPDTPPSTSSSPTPPPAEATHFSRALPAVPYGLPSSRLFDEERLGGFQVDWLQSVVPSWRDQVAQSRYLPSKDALWASPAHEALFELAARGQPYHDTLKTIMEHSYFFLFESVMLAEDAPLPHVMYEDFMKCLSFASLQNVPEEQFALSTKLLKHLLCIAACTCTVDKHYFTSAQQLFRRLEQQQPHMGSELLSAWVYVCTAAGRLDTALDYAHLMSRSGLRFDPEVFALMMHPSVSVVPVLQGNMPHVAKGLVVQQRLCARLQETATTTATTRGTHRHAQQRQQQQQQDTTTASVALHAMLVYHILTLQHAQKWELVRLATQPARLVPMLPRTRQLAVSLFASEKGLRCGPRSTKALIAQLVKAAVATGTNAHEAATMAADVLYVLLRTRVNEGLPAFAALPKTAFVDAFEYTDDDTSERGARAEDDALFVLQHVRRQPQRGGRAAPARMSWHEHSEEGMRDEDEERGGSVESVWRVTEPLMTALLDDNTHEAPATQSHDVMVRPLRGPKDVLAALKQCAGPNSPWPEAARPARQLLDRIAVLDGLAASQQQQQRAPGSSSTAGAAPSLASLADMATKAARAAEHRVNALQPAADNQTQAAAAVVEETVAQLREEVVNWHNLIALAHVAAEAPDTGARRPSTEGDSSSAVRPVLTGADTSVQFFAAQHAMESERDAFIDSFASQAWIDPSSGKDFLK